MLYLSAIFPILLCSQLLSSHYWPLKPYNFQVHRSRARADHSLLVPSSYSYILLLRGLPRRHLGVSELHIVISLAYSWSGIRKHGQPNIIWAFWLSELRQEFVFWSVQCFEHGLSILHCKYFISSHVGEPWAWNFGCLFCFVWNVGFVLSLNYRYRHPSHLSCF